MSGHSSVPASLWNDLAPVANGDPYVHALGLYLWTCRHRRATGLFYIPVEYIMSDLKYPREHVVRGLQGLHASNFARYDERAGWVFVREYAAVNLPCNGPFHKNDHRLKAVRAQVAEASQRAPRLAEEWLVLYDHLLPSEPQRRIAVFGSSIQFDRGDQTVRRGGPPPFEGGGHPPSKGGAPPLVGILEDPHQDPSTTGTTDRTAAATAADPVENRPDGSPIQSPVVAYQQGHTPVAYHPDDTEAPPYPPSPSQSGLPLPLASVPVERMWRRGRTTTELAREPAPDQNVRMLRLFGYEAFDQQHPGGWPAGGLSWEQVGDLVEAVQVRAAHAHVDYQCARLAVDHVCLMRQKGVGGPPSRGT